VQRVLSFSSYSYTVSGTGAGFSTSFLSSSGFSPSAGAAPSAGAPSAVAGFFGSSFAFSKSLGCTGAGFLIATFSISIHFS